MTATIQYYFKGHIPSGKTRQIMGKIIIIQNDGIVNM